MARDCRRHPGPVFRANIGGLVVEESHELLVRSKIEVHPQGLEPIRPGEQARGGLVRELAHRSRHWRSKALLLR